VGQFFSIPRKYFCSTLSLHLFVEECPFFAKTPTPLLLNTAQLAKNESKFASFFKNASLNHPARSFKLLRTLLITFKGGNHKAHAPPENPTQKEQTSSTDEKLLADLFASRESYERATGSITHQQYAFPSFREQENCK
jgi:hypothetical protein